MSDSLLRKIAKQFDGIKCYDNAKRDIVLSDIEADIATMLVQEGYLKIEKDDDYNEILKILTKK